MLGPSHLFHPCRILQMLRENLEEEAIIMKDVPDWKVGPGYQSHGAGGFLSTAFYRKPRTERHDGARSRKGEMAAPGHSTGATSPWGMLTGAVPPSIPSCPHRWVNLCSTHSAGWPPQ